MFLPVGNKLHTMTTGKRAKQSQRLPQVVLTLLLLFVVTEMWLQQLQLGISRTTCSRSATRIPTLANSPTLHEAFKDKNVIHWENLTELAPEGMRTYIDTSESEEARFLHYGLSPLGDICIRPNGTIVVVGLSREEFSSSLSEAMAHEWKETYNCSWGCNGAAFEEKPPENALWINGTTTHIIPYLGNVFHHFAERVWPHLTSGTVPSQYYVHRMHTWLEQAHHNIDRNTLMFQIALLAGSTPFLQHTEEETRPLCFQRLILCSATAGRMSPRLGLQLGFGPAIARYRASAFKLFAVPNPVVSTPPCRPRVTLYGRSDASRRRIVNVMEVLKFLQKANPPLEVAVVDEMMRNGEYNQTIPEVVTLMAQTDVYITPHGANTWATLFLPERAVVIEIYGPCGPQSWIHESIVPALDLKHDVDGNPWGVKVANRRAGNTTECKSALETPDFSVDVGKLARVMKRLGVVKGPV